MCSHQSISDTYCGDQLSENWEENLWANVLSPSSNASSTSTYQSQVSETAVQMYSECNVNLRSSDHQIQFSTTHETMESYPISPPTLKGVTFEIPKTCTDMSTYFSTFNPSTQVQEVSTLDSTVRNITNLKIQNTASTSNRKLHQARINLVPPGNGNFKAIAKRKRKRTIFTTEQLEVLEDVYSKKPYVTRDERQILVQQLQVNDKSVKIWFQNRRLKNKRVDDQEAQDDNQVSILDRLETVEMEINERTDEYGYVTLDDQIMKNLVNVVDGYFANKISPVETRAENEYKPIYEPISPASTSENSCEENSANYWQFYETTDIGQEVFDIESMLAL